MSTEETKKETKVQNSAKQADLKASEKKSEPNASVTKETTSAPKTEQKLKILFCVSEAQPFAATGGLGEVGGSLPKAIKESAGDLIDIRVMLPLYQVVSSETRRKFTFLGNMNIDIGHRSEYCGVFELKEHNIIYYFLDNEKYFKRNNLYGYDDDGERFAFFSKACLDTITITDFKPDILHANDWQTAMAIVYLKTLLSDVKEFAKIKTLFTLHNLNYQGKISFDSISNALGLDYRHRTILEYSGEANLVKAAIQCCDMFNAVSPTYAEEIKQPGLASGLDNCIQENAHKLVGILNGIDYNFYNPKTDKELFENFDEKNLDKKLINKRGVQKLFQMQIDNAIPLLLYNGRLTEQKGIDIIKDCIDTVLSDRIQMIVMGNGEKRYESYFDFLEDKYMGKFKVVRYSNNLSKKLYAAADMVIMPSLFEPSGLCQMIASRYATIPIVRETGGLKDSITDFGCEGGGNGYTFRDYSANDLLYSIKRGVSDFVADGPAWIDKMKSCINKDFSWKKTVKNYIELYRKIKKVR